MNRLIQTVIHCNHRYSDLENDIQSLKLEELSDPEIYRKFMIRYWSLKSDQFDYWLAGFIDPDAFVTWFSSTAKHFATGNGLFGEMNFRDGWGYGREYHKGINPWFVRFIDVIEKTYPEGERIDPKFQKLKAIIDVMEGTRDNPGLTQSFRKAFQEGMDWEGYKKWNEKYDKELLAEEWAQLY